MILQAASDSIEMEARKNMKTKLQLYCDDCKCPITDHGDGELAWARDDEGRTRVRVVHAPYACPRWKDLVDCLPRHVRERGTAGLDRYVGYFGLLELLEEIEAGEFPQDVGLELIRRLHVRGYEQYRLGRREMIADGDGEGFPAKPDASALRKFLRLSKETSGDESSV